MRSDDERTGVHSCDVELLADMPLGAIAWSLATSPPLVPAQPFGRLRDRR